MCRRRWRRGRRRCRRRPRPRPGRRGREVEEIPAVDHRIAAQAGASRRPPRQRGLHRSGGHDDAPARPPFAGGQHGPALGRPAPGRRRRHPDGRPWIPGRLGDPTAGRRYREVRRVGREALGGHQPGPAVHLVLVVVTTPPGRAWTGGRSKATSRRGAEVEQQPVAVPARGRGGRRRRRRVVDRRAGRAGARPWHRGRHDAVGEAGVADERRERRRRQQHHLVVGEAAAQGAQRRDGGEQVAETRAPAAPRAAPPRPARASGSRPGRLGRRADDQLAHLAAGGLVEGEDDRGGDVLGPVQLGVGRRPVLLRAAVEERRLHAARARAA